MIQVEALDYFYQSNRKILDAVSFDAQRGLCLAILGNNGAGKSTLLKCLNHIFSPRQGMIQVCGQDLRKMKRQEIAQNIAYVAQQGETARFTVYDAVLLGRKPYIRLDPAPADYEITERVLRQLGLEDYALRYIDELSGGELQKVMLARALAQEPKVLLLDEPTSSLDLKNQYEILKLVREIAKAEQICVILVIHDLNLALRYCDRFLFLKDSKIDCYGGPEVMTAKQIEAVYGVPVAVERIHGALTVIPFPQNETTTTILPRLLRVSS